MSDFISRADAIIAIKNLYPQMPVFRPLIGRWKQENKPYMKCERAIRDLPPVDIQERIACKIVFPEEQQAALLSSLKKSLANMPIMAIQDEPMPMRLYARWIELENPDYSPFDPTSHEYDLLCSLCGATHNGPNRNFCPNCGADMREEQHG